MELTTLIKIALLIMLAPFVMISVILLLILLLIMIAMIIGGLSPCNVLLLLTLSLFFYREITRTGGGF